MSLFPFVLYFKAKTKLRIYKFPITLFDKGEIVKCHLPLTKQLPPLTLSSSSPTQSMYNGEGLFNINTVDKCAESTTNVLMKYTITKIFIVYHS